MTINDKVAKRIKLLRITNGLTQKEVAKSLELTLFTYKNLEGGRIEINTHHIEKVSEFYNVDANYLFDIPTSVVPDLPKFKRKELELIDKIEKLIQEKKDLIEMLP